MSHRRCIGIIGLGRTQGIYGMQKNKHWVVSLVSLILVLFYFNHLSHAADNPKPGSENNEEELLFSAPPRESPQEGEQTYGPIAEFLSKILGRKIVYKHPGNWMSYAANMRKDLYAVVFDGPHFVSWRIYKKGHFPTVKIPGDFYFVFVTKKDNKGINKVKDLVGKKVCGHAPPNQGTLRLFEALNNPMRQPILVQVKGWRNIFQKAIDGECAAGIVPYKIYNELDPRRVLSKVIYETKHVSGQAITLSKRFTLNEAEKARDALLSPEGQEATKALRDRFASPPLVAATQEEFEGEYTLLLQSYGFDRE